MSLDYLKTIKLGHQTVVEALSTTQPFARSYQDAKAPLRSLREILAMFLGRQDQALFDRLYQFYSDDRPSTKMIDFLVHDLKDIKIQYLIFFDKYSTESWLSRSSSFPKDFGDFSSQVLARIKIEEEYLFPLLQKMAEASGE